MARRRRKQSWEEKLIELTMAGGAVAGLLSAADTATGRHASTVCHPRHGVPTDCISRSINHALTPYVKGAGIGAVAGLLLGALLVMTWRCMRGAKSGPFARRTPEPAARREAIPERVRHEVWRRDRGTCVDCGSRARLEFDHIIPLSRGGSSTARNLEIRCERCNRSKGARI